MNGSTNCGDLRSQWSRIKQAIRRVTPHRFQARLSSKSRHSSESRHTALTFSSPGGSSVYLVSRPPQDLVFPISFETPPVDPNHNGKLAIGRLPPELLAQIFVFVCEACDIADYSWIGCSYICSSWRQIALDTPHLWSHVVFRSSKWMRLCIERSKASLLIIEAVIAPRNSSVESLVSDVLVLTDRIGRITIRFQFLSNNSLLERLAGPFPMLTSFSLESNSWWSAPYIPFNPDVQPYPRLRTFVIRSHIAYLPPLPAHLVWLEITSGEVEDVPWNVLYDALQLLVELETLKLESFSVSASTSTPPICLPNLRDLHLTASPARCTQFIQTILCPCIRRYCLNLNGVSDIGAMFRTVLATLSQSPRSMVLHREYGRTFWSDCHRIPNYMDPGDFQHAMVGFAYADARDLRDHITPDISFSWTIALNDYEFAAIFVAVSEITVIDNVQWLLLVDWNVTPQESWRRLLQRLVRLQTLVISSLPASGLLWDLVHQLEASATTGDAPLCPDLAEIEVNRVDCSAGGWMARRRHGPGQVNSYVDLDGARFLEVLVCYLELRPIKLPKLKLVASINYTGAEVKLLRRLVDQLQWDGMGAVGPSYGANGDEFGAMTINHELLSRRSGYQECNLTEDERWKRRNWGHWW